MIFWHIIKRELQIAMRKQAEILNPLWFFLIVITLFPLVIGPDPELLSRIAPGVAWVAALLSALLSFERLFRDDYIDGSLEQLMLTSQPLVLTALAKVLAHWLLTGLPLILLSPIVVIGNTNLVGVGADIIIRHTGIELSWCYWCRVNSRFA